MEDSEGVFTAGSLGELCVPRSAAALSPATERDAGTDLEREVLRLFDEFRSPLLRYGLSLGISMHDAEEVVQETFLALFKHLQQGRPRANLRGWIFRVTHNLALKQSYPGSRWPKSRKTLRLRRRSKCPRCSDGATSWP
jgi:hypothetical protein